jgi:hypothetical protein
LAGPDFQSQEARLAWALGRMYQDYNQREILAFGIEILMSGNEDTPELAPEGIGLEMVWLKTVIDALDR